MSKKVSFLHKIGHLFFSWEGECYSFSKNGKSMMGFRCQTCGIVDGIHCIDALKDLGVAVYSLDD